ncbi:MAG: hypothetical protein CMM01_04080 [Rhodopirellula sp.]|nr:hypothetical protein [Rhodopirellula sp.]
MNSKFAGGSICRPIYLPADHCKVESTETSQTTDTSAQPATTIPGTASGPPVWAALIFCASHFISIRDSRSRSAKCGAYTGEPTANGRTAEENFYF